MKTKLAEYLEHFLLIKDLMAELTQLDGVSEDGQKVPIESQADQKEL